MQRVSQITGAQMKNVNSVIEYNILFYLRWWFYRCSSLSKHRVGSLFCSLHECNCQIVNTTELRSRLWMFYIQYKSLKFSLVFLSMKWSKLYWLGDLFLLHKFCNCLINIYTVEKWMWFQWQKDSYTHMCLGPLGHSISAYVFYYKCNTLKYTGHIQEMNIGQGQVTEDFSLGSWILAT